MTSPTPSPADRLKMLMAIREEMIHQGLSARMIALEFSVAEEASALLSDHARLMEENGRLREALTEARRELHSWAGDGSGSDPVLARIDAALSSSQKEGGGNG